MKKYFKYIVSFFVGFVVLSCATSRVVKPLNKGETEVGGTLGGPIVGLGKSIIPLPMSSVYVSHGFTDSLTAFGGLNTTSMLFGVGQLDLGASYGFMKPQKFRPGIVATGAFNFMLDRWDKKFRFYPQLDIHTYWDYRQGKGALYSGLSNWFELNKNAANGLEQQQFWSPNIYLGTKLNGKKLNWSFEGRYIAPNYKSDFTVVDWKGIGNKGTFGVYFGVSKTF